ncbi:MAG: transposase [Deltaproteobacteria bacterium]|nr:transposase [Deltaproteobacteria bacterium]
MNSDQWPDEEMAAKYKIMVSEALSDKDGDLIADGTDFKKMGTETPGVGRQYLGSVGKGCNGVAFVVGDRSNLRWFHIVSRFCDFTASIAENEWSRENISSNTLSATESSLP